MKKNFFWENLKRSYADLDVSKVLILAFGRNFFYFSTFVELS